jgi:hypothetical protein
MDPRKRELIQKLLGEILKYLHYPSYFNSGVHDMGFASDIECVEISIFDPCDSIENNFVYLCNAQEQYSQVPHTTKLKFTILSTEIYVTLYSDKEQFNKMSEDHIRISNYCNQLTQDVKNWFEMIGSQSSFVLFTILDPVSRSIPPEDLNKLRMKE